MKRTALYRHFDKDGALLYVGISLNPLTRIKQHNDQSFWAHDAVRMETEWFETKLEAQKAEMVAIRKEKPKHNIVRYGVSPKLEETEEPAKLFLVLPAWLKTSIINKSDNLGISMAEYIKDTLKCSVISDSSTSRENKP